MRRIRTDFPTHAVIAVILVMLCTPSAGAGQKPDAAPAAGKSGPNDPNRYLNAVREFADNVLKYGKDTYGPKHTPLFVDGLNIRTHEPVKWIAPNGDRWILSNLASQQNFFRTLDGLTRITGDPKYKQAAMDAIKYAFENLRSPNGLLYWGECAAYDAGADETRSLNDWHVLKAFYPYYELMWEVNPYATEQMIESFWASHILNWSNLDMNRIGLLNKLSVSKGWNHEYKGQAVFFKSKGVSFDTAASDLYYAGATLFKLSGQEKPLIWAKRLAYRYVETRDSRTGISGHIFTLPKSASKHPLANDFKGHIVHEGTIFNDLGWGDPLIRRLRLHSFTFSPGVVGNTGLVTCICQFLIGEMLGSEGKEFHQWALEELTSRGKIAYRREDNSWIPMLTDGTSLEGYVLENDNIFPPNGTVFKAWEADLTDFWAYTLAYSVTGDKFMWEIARSILRGNSLGDIGTDCQEEPKLNIGTDCSNAHALLSFLALYEKTRRRPFLKMAQRIGDNILANRFHNGFFVPSERFVYAKLDAIESLTLLKLYGALASDCPGSPTIWPSIVRYDAPYRSKGKASDSALIYTLTEFPEPPMSLNEASAIGNIDLVKSLIANGADVNNIERGQGEFTNPLHRAVVGGYRDIVELLLIEGANVNTKGGWYVETPLHRAIRAGHKDIAELLIANDADINAKNNDGQTPVDLAFSQDRRDIVELLFAKGADISLHAASRFGDLAVVKSLIEKGACINAKDTSGRTALHYAAEHGRKDIAELLIANGANVNAKDKDGNTPGHVALDKNNRSILELLIAKGANFTSIHLSAYQGDLDEVKSFIDKGANVNAKSKFGQTPLHKAAIGGHKDVVALLIDSGADVNARSRSGYTPMYYAAWSGSTEVVELLVEKGADVNAKDRWDWTPLHYAASRDNGGMALLLITRGADVNAKDNSGETALSVAKRKGHTEIVELLRRHGARE